MGNNYDPVAWCYDFLSQILFGQAEINAQVELLHYSKPGNQILIVGGGTGWILEKLSAVHPAGLRITYVESSFNMMSLSKKRDWQQNDVVFVQSPVEQFDTQERYDCILTGFFFDNFSKQAAETVFLSLHRFLKSGGYWLFSDFYYRKHEGKLWQAFLLKSMYISARLICKVDGRELADIEPLFITNKYRECFTAFHYWRFIKSIVYQK